MLQPKNKNWFISRYGGFPRGSDGKESVLNVGDLGSVPGLGRSPGIGNGNPLQYACLENSRAWQATLMRLQSDITERLNRTDLTFKFATAEEKGNFYPFLAA